VPALRELGAGRVCGLEALSPPQPYSVVNEAFEACRERPREHRCTPRSRHRKLPVRVTTR
jgi:hypothetical protein